MKIFSEELVEKAVKELGEANADIFDIHMMMLEDEDYFGAISNMIKTQSVNAEYAVSYTSDIFARTFSEMSDEYMRARREDVLDISKIQNNKLKELLLKRQAVKKQ